jgi:hypothetical protein
MASKNQNDSRTEPGRGDQLNQPPDRLTELDPETKSGSKFAVL